MTSRRRSPSVSDAEPVREASASSWMALLASTSLGVDGSTFHALVRADDTASLDDLATYRLVVQSYDGSIRRGARPVGSTQRVVRGAELRRGVDVSLVELRAVSSPAREEAKGLIVAWIEEGTADLELDGRRARPQPGQVYGMARRAAGTRSVRIPLGRKLRLAAA
jgi:hypothetical protein